jgi:hypothetical protein
MTPLVKYPLPGMNYGFVVMPWQMRLVRRLIMVGLFVVQIVARSRSQPKMSG